MRLTKGELRKIQSPLVEFIGYALDLEGMITLSVTLGEASTRTIVLVNFLVIKIPNTYNIIFGRPVQAVHRAVVFVLYFKMKFPTPSGIGVVKRDQRVARECYTTSLKMKRVLPIELLVVQDERKGRGKPVDELEKV
ncbi:hypothetical protein CFOL_v3_24037 [Cephalotus follicularis]|uniref:Uncharacterized protein n=1 Tax=Cephalotus follicularis TaxID=3775 RepID=A0A1Q3CK27_CEPFO|nr:hypothetical protein CFOL_v3_24037 [Cephalotus follicularis]